MNIKSFFNKSFINYAVRQAYFRLKDIFGLRQIVWGRVACVGRDVFYFVFDEANFKLVNIQKWRLDSFADWLGGNNLPDYKTIKSFIIRQDILPFIKQEGGASWNRYPDFNFLIMDSYSELTDQKFINNKFGWYFFSHYGDINHGSDFANIFESQGLLDIDKIAKTYADFFSWFFARYPDKKVFFLHYSAKLDMRDKFKERVKIIEQVMLSLALKYENIKNIMLDDEQVDYYEGDDFPYHYSAATEKAYAAKLKDLSKV